MASDKTRRKSKQHLKIISQLHLLVLKLRQKTVKEKQMRANSVFENTFSGSHENQKIFSEIITYGNWVPFSGGLSVSEV